MSEREVTTRAATWWLGGIALVLLLACGGAERTADGEQVAGRDEVRGRGAGEGRGPGSPATLFQRYADRTENAFTILVPQGWQTRGGMVRVDPSAAGGVAQSLEAKLDFAIQKDAAGTVMIRWLPHIYYADLRGTPAGGMFPPGSNYGGMMVRHLMTPLEFARQVTFPEMRPGAGGVRVVEEKRLDGLARVYQRLFDEGIGQHLGGFLHFEYDAGLVTVEYDEGGTRYREGIVVVTENRGAAVAGQWCNRLTVAMRAPAAEAERWEPVLAVVASSTEIDPRWVAGELRGQIQRGEIAARTQREVQAIERAIVEHRQQTNAEIMNDVFLTLTEQEEFVDPFTGETETGSNQWQCRWRNEQGDVLYTDDESYDPNDDAFLHAKGFKRTPVRPRKP